MVVTAVVMVVVMAGKSRYDDEVAVVMVAMMIMISFSFLSHRTFDWQVRQLQAIEHRMVSPGCRNNHDNCSWPMLRQRPGVRWEALHARMPSRIAPALPQVAGGRHVLSITMHLWS